MFNVINWKINEMKGLKSLFEEINVGQNLEGLNIAVYLHGTSESAIFMYYLKKLGANVFYSSCNPLSLQEGIIKYLIEIGVHSYSHFGENVDDINENIKKIFENKIDIIIDDGCALVSYVVKNNLSYSPLFAAEQTSWGINKVINLIQSEGELDFPIIGVNNHKTKHHFDNNKGVSSSLISCILDELHISLSGKKILIFGYGSVGKGLARDLKALGARVCISEILNYPALEAHYDGFEVGLKKNLMKKCDFLITCTGNKGVINEKDFLNIKDKSILINVGHSDVEIDVRSLYENSKKIEQISNHIEEIEVDNKKLYLFAKGRVANLVAGEGNPPEIMDLTFMNQLYAVHYGLKNRAELKTYQLNDLGYFFDDVISKIKLKSYGIEIDEKTHEQVEYLSKWQTQI